MSSTTTNSISLKTAIEFFHKRYPMLEARNVVDYREYYVIDAMPKGYDVKKDGPFRTSLRCVRKSDGKVFGFNPMDHDPKAFFKAVDERLVRLEVDD